MLYHLLVDLDHLVMSALSAIVIGLTSPLQVPLNS